MGLYMNDDGELEPLDGAWEKIGQKGIDFSGDSDDSARISSPSANNLAINTGDGSTMGTAAFDGNVTIAGDLEVEEDFEVDDLAVSGDITQEGGRTLNSATVNDAIGGHQASFSFDGATDYVTVADTSDELDFGANDFSVSLWAKSGLHTAFQYFANKYDGSNPANGWGIGRVQSGHAEAGNIQFWVYANGANAESFSQAPPDENWHYYAVTADRSGNLSLYIDGVLDSSVSMSGIAGVSINNTVGTRIGAYAGTGTYGINDGQISQVRIHNRALSADEVRAAYNGQAVGFEHRDGGQNVVIGDSSTFTNSKGGWSVSGAATISEAGVFDLNGGYGYLNIDSASPYGNVEEGRKYRITGDISSVTGTWSFWYYQSGPTEYVQIASGTGDLSVDFEIPSNYNNYFRFLGSGGDVEFTLDNFKITKIGCVAEYLPESISDNAWLDSSGNELNGSVSGATAVNAETNVPVQDGHLVESKTVADLQSGASYSFDGVNDEIAIGDTDNLSFGNGTSDNPFSLSAWIYVRDAAYFPILNKGVYNTTDAEWNLMSASDGKLRMHLYDESVAGTYQIAEVSSVLTTGEWIHVCSTYNGVGGTSANAGILIYINGVSQDLTLLSAGTYVAMENLGSEVRIGNYADSVYWADGQISQVRIHNRALSAAEVRAAYNGQAVGFEHRGASQTLENVSSFVNVSGYEYPTFSGASATGFTAASNETATNIASTADEISLVKGKAYRVQFDFDYVSGEVPLVRISASATGADLLFLYGTSLGASTNLPTSDQTMSSEFIYTGTSQDAVLKFQNSIAASYVISNLSITQIGCVAEYLPESISDSTWLDTSGNELDGSVSGATAVNAESGIVGRDSHLVESKTVADLQSGASFKFDGVAATQVAPPNSTHLNPGYGDYSLHFRFRADSFPALSNYLYSNRYDSTSNFAFNIKNDGSVYHNAVFSGMSGTLLSRTEAGVISLGEWYDVVYVIDRDVSTYIYVNGVSQTLDDNDYDNGVNNFSWNAVPSIGAYQQGLNQNFDGEISHFRFHNRALSAAEVRAAYNGQAVPYEYVGASQDELVTGYTNLTNYLYETYSSSGATITDAHNTGGYGMAHSNAITLTQGKKYRLTYSRTLDDGAAPNLMVSSTTTGAFAYDVDDHPAHLTTSDSGTLVFEVTSTRSYYVVWRVDNGDTSEFSSATASLTQIGCVAEYLPSGINATQWVDTSGNGLHGTTSTATAVNHTTGTLTLESGANLKMQDGGGIDFSNYTGATLTGTPESNLLDDYEEGVWQPVLTDLTNSAVTNVLYLDANYVKIGRTVFVNGFFAMTDKTDPVTTNDVTGNLAITGLPFVGGIKADSGSFSVGYYHQANITAGMSIGLYKTEASARMWLTLSDDTAGVSILQGSEILDTFNFVFSGHYSIP